MYACDVRDIVNKRNTDRRGQSKALYEQDMDLQAFLGAPGADFDRAFQIEVLATKLANTYVLSLSAVRRRVVTHDVEFFNALAKDEDGGDVVLPGRCLSVIAEELHMPSDRLRHNM
ncbi:Aste57867_17492 [Aphanomyces stellatus]|uniref:Aste57867_17491 protein n=1 Tax=Aphanomyces stellatus TaxID=120398 RepID=A0A485L7U8_9STRA|nr:hypothetical protein As57867_017431 [Aphanomyces stellatus]KAF0691239.1 hypothetical protein As57867_017432 [Aphanomyces stellatus]KAF0715202.1 hypothetical protein As57867_003507 [Aphanomyces stellatus]VFT80681.1 Aste57867_3518 [Aphanomyces stellatus]VFT94244.1 Aste57867_17491 [Aphanomyces stellatus]